MAGLIVSALLVTSMLVVHISVRRQPLPSDRPLNVDTGLPLPEVGQASTVFSLSALFGAYLGIYLILGLPALVGLAAGTVGALLLIRRWIDICRPESFEAYLSHVLGSNSTNAIVLAMSLAVVQCAFATSEMAILRDFARASLGLHDNQANLLVVTLAVIAYFYVLFGGYLAVFRTDLVQFIYIAVTAVGVLGVTATQGLPRGWRMPVAPRPGYWSMPLASPDALLYTYHVLMGMVMGFSFLIASPDVWKRVYLVSRARNATRRRFALFLLVGAAPFLLLIPLAAAIPRITDGLIDANALWAKAASNEPLFIVAALCLVASFLSAYNGAFTLSVHLGLMAKRRMQPVDNESTRFYWLMAVTLLAVACGFAFTSSVRNPYVLGNLLLGPYAILAGIYFGGHGTVEALPRGAVLWITILGALAWFLYFAPRAHASAPSTYQINTVPVAILLACLVAGTCQVLKARGNRHDR